MNVTPIPYRARALLGDDVVADSQSAVRVDRVGEAPELWFPFDAVDASRRGDAWREGAGELSGHLRVDADGVRFEIVDAGPGDDERDITIKSFPNWGDAADLIRIMDVQPQGDGRYTSAFHSDGRRPVVEASQILGQCIVAASRHTPGRRVVSTSMVFPRAADARAAYDIGLDPVTEGRTFTVLRAEAVQGERTCAVGTLLLDVTAPDVIRHADPAPDVPGPYECAVHDMWVTGRDLRIVDDAYTGDPDAPVGPPELDVWVRFRDVPDDPPLHAGLLAQFAGHMSIAAAMRPHAGIGQDQAHRTLSTGVNAISISLHADVRADRWMLYHHRSTFAGDGMTHSECRVYREDGALLASFTVDAMIRAFADASMPVDERSSL